MFVRDVSPGTLLSLSLSVNVVVVWIFFVVIIFLQDEQNDENQQTDKQTLRERHCRRLLLLSLLCMSVTR